MTKPEKIVEVTRDALGWLLVWAKDTEGGQREGDPVELPMSGDVAYFKSKSAAQKAAAHFNAGRTKEAFGGAM